jgi:hypothetical protein
MPGTLDWHESSLALILTRAADEYSLNPELT